MEEVLFDVVCSLADLGDSKMRDTFGLGVKLRGENSESLHAIYWDLSYEKESVERFIDLLIRNRVSLVHIDEMIDDYFFTP